MSSGGTLASAAPMAAASARAESAVSSTATRALGFGHWCTDPGPAHDAGVDDGTRVANDERSAGSVLYRTAAASAGAAVSLWLGAQPSFSWQSYVGVGAVSGWYLAKAALGRPARVSAPRRLHPTGIAWWSAVVLAFSALEIVDDRLGSTPAHPTLSSAMDPVLEHPLARAVAVALWILAGRELVRR